MIYFWKISIILKNGGFLIIDFLGTGQSITPFFLEQITNNFQELLSYFQSKVEREISTIVFSIFKLDRVTNLSLNRQFWFFRPNFPEEGISNSKQKNNYHHCIWHIRISAGIKYHIKQTILFFFYQIFPKMGEKCPNGKFCFDWLLKCWCFTRYK